MNTDRIIALLAAKTSGSISPQELDELAGLLKEHPEYHYIQEINDALQVNTTLHNKVHDAQLLQNSWDKLTAQMQQGSGSAAEAQAGARVVRLRQRNWWKLAAVVAGVMLVSAVVLFTRSFNRKKEAISPYEITASNGARTKTVLPDGTVVLLNAGSKLKIAAGFNRLNRNVELDGEAFFDVAQNKDLPFHAQAANITINVLGTTFNVKAYRADAFVETSLLKGKVELLLNNDPDKKVQLSPNEKIVVYKTASLPQKQQGNILLVNYRVQPLVKHDVQVGYTETAWISNKLSFWNEPFQQVAEKMERWYDVRIHFVKAALAKEELSGTFEKETIEQALQLLQLTTHFSFRISGKDIYLQ